MTTIGSLVRDRPVFSVRHDSTILEAAKYMAERNAGAVAVYDGTRLVGIFSERDIITRVIARGLDPSVVRVEQAMTKDLVVADAGESEESCLRKMKAANCRHLPVVSGEQFLGLISLRDLLQLGLSERDEKIEFLHSYLFHLSPDAEKRSKG